MTTHPEAEDLTQAMPDLRKEEQPDPSKPREVGGRQGAEPTRFGDWELRGRCIDF